MRLSDFTDWWTLRAITWNPWEVVRFRERRNEGHDLEVNLRDGHRLYLRSAQLDYQLFKDIYVRDEYCLASQTGKRWSVVIDIGANVGIFARRVVSLADRVICYGPSRANFMQLERNTCEDDNIETFCEAVAGASGVRRPHRPSDGGHSARFTFYPESGLKAEGFDASDDVKATSLDSLFERHRVEHCELLKIDAEGAEYEILYSASDATLARVSRIIGEYHDVRPEDPRTRLANFAAHLQSKGYAVRLDSLRRRANQGHFFAERT